MSLYTNQPRVGGKLKNLRRHRARVGTSSSTNTGTGTAAKKNNIRDNDDNPPSDSGSEDRFHQVDTIHALLASINSLPSATNAMSPAEIKVVESLDRIYWGSHKSWLSPVVIESHKLVFFLPPHAHKYQGTTTWRQLFYKLLEATASTRSTNRDSTDDSEDFQLPRLHDYSIREADHIMTSPEWTRAFFVQDPREWFMEAYNILIVKNGGRYLHKFPLKRPDKCCLQGQTPQQCVDTITANPNKFMAALIRGCSDPNWDPQIQRMESKYWPYINFIGHSHYSTIAKDAQALLTKIGAWENFGNTGWGDDGKQPIFATSKHIDTQKQQQRQLRQWYSYNLEKKVFDYYKPDYQHFNLSWLVPMYPQLEPENNPVATTTLQEGKFFSL